MYMDCAFKFVYVCGGTVNPFIPNAPLLYPLKTTENRKVF